MRLISQKNNASNVPNAICCTASFSRPPTKTQKRGSWPRFHLRSARIARCSIPALLGGRLVHLGHVVPVDQVVEERLQIIRPAIAIVDVVGMLPHVAAENRLG